MLALAEFPGQILGDHLIITTSSRTRAVAVIIVPLHLARSRTSPSMTTEMMLYPETSEWYGWASVYRRLAPAHLTHHHQTIKQGVLRRFPESSMQMRAHFETAENRVKCLAIFPQEEGYPSRHQSTVLANDHHIHHIYKSIQCTRECAFVHDERDSLGLPCQLQLT